MSVNNNKGERINMKLYRVMNACDHTNEEAVGAEIHRLHRTEAGAQDALDSAGWDSDWGTAPVLMVVEMDEYATEEDAIEAGFSVTR